MSERPPGKGGPEEGTPEYDWLYGKGGKGSPPPGGRPDESEVCGWAGIIRVASGPSLARSCFGTMRVASSGRAVPREP